MASLFLHLFWISLAAGNIGPSLSHRDFRVRERASLLSEFLPDYAVAFVCPPDAEGRERASKINTARVSRFARHFAKNLVDIAEFGGEVASVARYATNAIPPDLGDSEKNHRVSVLINLAVFKELFMRGMAGEIDDWSENGYNERGSMYLCHRLNIDILYQAASMPRIGDRLIIDDKIWNLLFHACGTRWRVSELYWNPIPISTFRTRDDFHSGFLVHLHVISWNGSWVVVAIPEFDVKRDTEKPSVTPQVMQVPLPLPRVVPIVE